MKVVCAQDVDAAGAQLTPRDRDFAPAADAAALFEVAVAEDEAERERPRVVVQLLLEVAAIEVLRIDARHVALDELMSAAAQPVRDPRAPEQIEPPQVGVAHVARERL